jgi:multicomponent Na+:H+ antiporter subunit D
MLLCAIALLSHTALAGVAVYIVGHGLTKGALFMCAGVLLHRFATIDEYDLHGRGRDIPLVGLLMAVGALSLAAIPPVTTFMGKSLLEEGASGTSGYGWLIAVFVVVSAVTGGAVLRVTARVFLGWGSAQGRAFWQHQAAEEGVDEIRTQRSQTPVLMVIMPALLLVAAVVAGLVPGAVPGVERYAAQFATHSNYAAWVLHGARVSVPSVPASHVSGADIGYAAIAVAGALLVAGLGLFGGRLLTGVRQSLWRPVDRSVGAIRVLHSGHIGDYIAWWSAGVSLIGGLCLLAVR